MSYVAVSSFGAMSRMQPRVRRTLPSSRALTERDCAYWLGARGRDRCDNPRSKHLHRLAHTYVHGSGYPGKMLYATPGLASTRRLGLVVSRWVNCCERNDSSYDSALALWNQAVDQVRRMPSRAVSSFGAMPRMQPHMRQILLPSSVRAARHVRFVVSMMLPPRGDDPRMQLQWRSLKHATTWSAAISAARQFMERTGRRLSFPEGSEVRVLDLGTGHLTKWQRIGGQWVGGPSSPAMRSTAPQTLGQRAMRMTRR